MRYYVLLSVIVCALLALEGCHPAKTGVGTKQSEPVEVTSENAEQVLARFEENMRQITMLNHDVVTNGDAIIALEKRNADIIRAIEAKSQVLTPTQLERFRALRETYRSLTGY